MFLTKKLNNLVNEVQKRPLRLSYKNNENNAQTLLSENNETSIYQRNLHFLMMEIYDVKNNRVLPIMDYLFQFRENNLNLRNFIELLTAN